MPEHIVTLIDALGDSRTVEEADRLTAELTERVKGLPDEQVGQIQFELYATIQHVFHEPKVHLEGIAQYIHVKLTEVFGIVDARFQGLDTDGQQHALEAIATRYMDVLREIAHRDDDEEPVVTPKRSEKSRNLALRKLKHAGLLTIDPKGSFHVSELGWKFVTNC